MRLDSRSPFPVAIFITALVLAAPVAHGQATTYARLVGTVKDLTGAVVPGAEITATAKATNVPRSGVTNPRGDYLIDKLIPGLYDVKAAMPGFRAQVYLDVRLEVTQVARVDFTLRPGDIADFSVTVSGHAPILDTESAEAGVVIEEKEILDLPLHGRSTLKLAYLTTGGTQEREFIGDRYGPFTFEGGGYPAFNGLYSHSNQITLDGADNMGYMLQRPAVQPTPETVQEFKIITNNYSAEYGRVGGAVISMLSKSGTNEYHGHAWYYLRDERFDASHFLTNFFGQEKHELNYHIFGGSVGGPIFRDRTFFHTHYERFIDDFAYPLQMTVPTLEMRAGDLSGSGFFGPIPQLYDPFNVVDGQRAAFAGNQIPQHRWNPVYRRLMELMPPPVANVPGATAQNYTFPFTKNGRTNKYSIRADHHFDNSATLFGRFSWQNTPETAHNGFNIGVPGADLHGVYRQFYDLSRGWQAAAGWVNPMDSNLVTELNVSIWKASVSDSPLDQVNWAAELGYDDADRHVLFYPDGSRGPGGLPHVAVGPYAHWQGARSTTFSDWGLGFKYTASWRKNDHYLKLGFEHRRNLDATVGGVFSYSAGQDRFDGFATGQIVRDAEDNIAGSTFGEIWADLMLGLPQSTTGDKTGEAFLFGRLNQSHYNWFVNDDWKVGPNLTLNLGLRWEQPRPPNWEGTPDGAYDRDYGYCAYDFSGGRIDPVQLMPSGFDIARWQGPIGLAVPFANLPRRECHQVKWRYFAPRLGLAWRLFGTSRTVLRLGAGLTYDQQMGIRAGRFLRPARGRISSIRSRGTETPDLFLGQRSELPTSVELGEIRGDGLAELDREEGQVYSYNLSIQHEIFSGTKLEVSYVGNQGRHIRNNDGFNNPLPEGYVAPLVGGGTVTLTSDPISAGPRSWIPGDTQDRVWSGQRARRLYPQIVPFGGIRRSDGNMYYSSLQTKLERRFRDGIALSLGWTWSKAMALNYSGTEWAGGEFVRGYERHALKTPMIHDRLHTFYSSTIWQLPFFSSSTGLSRALFGGWQAAGIVTLATGKPYLVFYGQDLWDLGRGVLPDRVGDGYLSESERDPARWFDVDAFEAPRMDPSLPPAERARRALGNSARTPLRGDGIAIVDISLHKEFPTGDGKTLDFRVDFFNAFNHAVFADPIGNIASPVAGFVKDAADPRTIQFGFRFSF